MKKFLPQQNLVTVDLNLSARDLKKIVNHIIIIMIMFFSASTFAQTIIPVDQPTGGFNINGVLTAGATVGVGDWVPGTSGGFVLNADGTPVHSVLSGRKIDGYKTGPTDLIFQGSKFNDNPNDWNWTTSDAGGKGDINNALFHLANFTAPNPANNEQWLFVAGDRKETNGTSNIYFEFLQNTLTRNTTTGKFNSAGPHGGRTINDVAIYIAYVGGGSSANILFYVWTNVGTVSNPRYQYQLRTPVAGTFYGFTNGGTVSVPFGAYGSTSYTTNQFIEAAFNVTRFLSATNLCEGLTVKTVFVSTKSSDQETANLDDFLEPIQIGLNLGTASISYGGPFCPVGTAPVNLAGVTGGTFSSTPGLSINQSSGLINLSNSTPGSYTVTYTFTTPGCTTLQTATNIVIINPFPSVPTVSVTNPTCALSTGTITVTSPANGVGITYTITGITPVIAPVTNATGVFSGLVPGTYTVTTTSSNCTSSATANIVINSQPLTPIAPTVSVVNNCGSSTLTASNYTGALLWSNGATTPTITVTNAATYTVTQTTVNGCTSLPGSETSAPKTIPVAPTVTVVNNCGSSTLTASAFTGTLLWSNGATTPTITVTDTATYTVTQTTDNGCTSLTGSGTSAPKTVPVAPTVTVVNNCGSSTLTASAYTGTLLWSNGATTPTITVTDAATYTVTQTTVNGCTSSTGSGTSAPKTVPVAPTVTVVNNCGSSTFTASAFTGTLLWSNGATTPTITVTDAATYTVTQTTLNGCTSLNGSGISAPKTVPVAPTVTVVNNCGSSTLTASAFTGTLLWSNGATTPTITVTDAATYTVTQTTANGCTSLSGSGTSAPKTVPVAPTVTVVNNCGSSTLTASAYTGTLLWSNGAITPSITVTDAATYTVTQTTANGCTSLNGSGTSAPKTVPVAPTVTVVNNCGSSTLTASVYTGTLLWSNGATTPSITVTDAATYTVTQTTLNGCTSLPGSGTSAPKVVPVAPTVTVVNNCGSSTLTASAFTGTLLWSNGVTTPSITVTNAATYTVTQTTANGCTSLPGSGTSAPKAVPDAPLAGTVTQPTCSVATGSFAITNYNASYTYIFSPSTGVVNTAGAVTAPAGTYTVTATLGTCISGTSANIVVNAQPVTPAVPLAGTVTQPTCSVATGSFAITNYNASYTYTFSPSTGVVNTAGTVTAPTGTYTITATLGACTSGRSANIVINAQPVTPAAPTASNQTVCADGNPNQTLTATATGGTITWYTAAIGGNFVASPTQVGVGTSTYYAQNSNGTCPSLTRTQVILTINNGPTAPVSGGDQTVCQTTPIQTLTATASGGTITWFTLATGGTEVANPILNTVGTVTYYAQSSGSSCSSLTRTGVTLTIKETPIAPTVTVVNNCGSSTLTASNYTGTLSWSNGATTPSITVTDTATYTVTQTTANGCTSLSGSGISAPKTVPVAPTVTVVNNCGSSTLTASAYTGTLLWSNGATTPAITVTDAATYTVTQTTLNGCTSLPGSGTSAPKVVPVAPTVTVVNNCGSSTLTASNFTGTLLWSNGAATPTITVTDAATYTVTQTTANGCTSLTGSGTSAPKTVPVAPTVTVVNNCGSSTLTASAYTGTLLWSNGATTPTITVTDAATYTVTQTTANGCASLNGSGTSAPKTVPVAPTVTVVNNCGSSTLTASAFTGTLLWSNGATTPSITVSDAATYTVTQTTANGCTSLAGSGTSVPKTVPVAPTVTVVNNCGSSTLTASAYTGTLLWSNGATTPTITVTDAATYTVTQTTVNGCTSSTGSGTSAPKTVPVAPTVTVVNNCGSSTLTASAFTGTLLWSNGATTPTITVTDAATYTVTQTTANGCASLNGSGTSAPKTVPVAPTVTVVNNCGSSTLTASAFTGTLLWSNGAITPSITVTDAATYTVTQTTANGCTSLAGSGTSAPKTVPVAPTVTVVNNCGSSTLTASAYTGTLLWSNGGATTPTITVTDAAIYTVTQTTANGCTSSTGSGTSAPKTVPVAPTVTVVNNCGSSTLTASNYTGTLLWSNNATTASITVTNAATYTVTQTTDNGCTSLTGSGTSAPKTIPAIPLAGTVTQLTCSVATGSFVITNYNASYTYNFNPPFNVVNTAGTVTAPAGTYTITATLGACTSGSSVNIVIDSKICANDDSGTSVNGATGGTSFTNVLINDTLNGNFITNPALVTTTFVSSTNPNVTLSGTNVVVAPGTPSGSYTLTYQICEVLNPANCDTADVNVPVGIAPIIAQNDLMPSTNGFTGNTNVGNVLPDNGSGADTLNNNPITDLTLVTMTVTSPAGTTGVFPTLNITTGVISVPAGTPAGTYNITYQICQNLNPNNCDTANVTIPVIAATIDAVNDTIAPTNGTNGNTNAGNVLTANGNGPDTLNSSPATIAQVAITVQTPAVPNSPGAPIPSVNTTTGVISIPANTPAGNYTITYQICEVLNPSNCDTAVVSVPVSAATIVAVNDTAGPIVGISQVTPNVVNVFTNDTLNDSPVNPSLVTLTTTISNPFLVLNPDGSVDVLPNAPVGPQTLTYKICEILNPLNCDDAIVTVTIVAPIMTLEANAICINDVPYVNYTATPVNFTPVNGVTIIWRDSNNNVISTMNNLPLSGQVLWPGAVVDQNGNGIDWPGWVFTNNQWIEAADGFEGLRPTANVTFALNPTQTIVLNYPPSDPLCTSRPTFLINAVNDNAGPIIGAIGATNVINVFTNDTLNNVAVNPSLVTLTTITPNPNLILNSNGSVDVIPGTPAGLYTLTYQICEIANTGNCDQAIVTVTVDIPAIDLLKNGTYVDSSLPAGASPGDTIVYNFTVTNTGNVPLTGVTITDPLVTVVGGPIALAVGQSNSTAFTATYVITQADINAGQVNNLATATGNPPVGPPVTDISTDPTPCTTCTPVPNCPSCTLTPIPTNPSIDLLKNGTYVDSSLPAGASPGDTIVYNFTVTNTGNVPLTNVTITDPLVTVVGGPIALAVGQSNSTAFTATYVITQADINAGQVNNLATATGNPPVGPPVTDISTDPTPCTTCTPVPNCPSCTLTPIPTNPSIDLLKNGTYVDSSLPAGASPGDTIVYNFTVTNTGNVPLTGVTITDPLVTVVGGPIALAVGQSNSTAFTATYVITQADINAGQVNNLATATGNPPVGPPVTDISTDPTPCTTCTPVPNCPSCTLTPIPTNPSIDLLKNGTYVDSSLPAGASPGDTIAYNFTVTNTGNVPLTGVTITDPLVTVVGGPIALAVGQSNSTAFTATYVITQADINAGQVNNLATATGNPPVGPPVTDISTDPTPCTTCTPVPNCPSCTLTPIPTNPSIDLLKNGTYVDSSLPAGASPGDTIVYNFTVTNTGNVPLTGVTITDPLVTVVGGPIALAVGQSNSTAFTATYIITQADINAGQVNNLATATGNPPVGPPVTDISTDPTPCTTCTPVPNCPSCTLTPIPTNPSIDLLKNGTYVDSSLPAGASPGDTIVYNFTVTNTGNVPLTNVTITDPLVTVVGGPIALAVGQSNSTAFTATYIITQADINAGQVNNLATATGNPPVGPPVTDISTDPTPCTTCTPVPNCPSCTSTALINAVDDTYSNVSCIASGIAGNIFSNDTIGSTLVNTTLASQVTLTILTGSNPNITISNNGNITIQSGIAIGTYTLTYRICSVSSPIICDEATITITIIDNTNPVWTSELPPNITVSCNNIPNAPILTGSDTCSVPVVGYIETITPGSCAGNYVITRTWTLTDASNNQITHIQIITVQDTTSPTFVGTLPANVTVQCSAIPEPVILTATDNCGSAVVTYTSVNTPGQCAGAYTITRTWTATDLCKLTTIHTQVITVQDTTPPTFVGTLPTNATVQCSAITEPAVLTATDNCGTAVVTFASVNTPGQCAGAYTITRSWTATDLCGLITVHTQVITVQDTTPPTFVGTLPTNATVQCSAITEPAVLTATDNCGTAVVTFASVNTPGQCAGAYTITRSWTATDLCGLTTVHTQVITVQDTTPPTFVGTLPTNATVQCSAITEPAVLTATDNCGTAAVTFASVNTPGQCAGAYTITRTWTATDLCGLTTIHTQVITVQDTTPPTFVGTLPTNATVQCSAITEPAVLTATDNCGTAAVTFTSVNTPGQCAGAYTITRTWTATDLCGLTTVHTQVITVQDTTPPTFVGTLPANVTVQCSAITEPAVLTATDNCGTAVVTFTSVNTPGQCAGAYTITRTWTATDLCGLTTVHTQVITVQDTTPPTFVGTLPANVTVQCSAITEPAVLTATDNCGTAVVTFASVNTPGQCAGAYTITRTWTATDLCGLTSIHTQVITVQDTTPPTFVGTLPANVTVQCSAITEPPVLTATDNCGTAVVTFASVNTPGQCAGAYTITRTWTATDLCGLTSVHTQVITVQDTTGPILVGQLPPTVNVTCDIIPPVPTLEFTDNCSVVGIPVFTETISSIVDGVYTITRTWVVSDSCGNSSQTYTQVIFVTQVTNVIAEIPAESCNEAEFDTIDLNSLLPQGTPTNGTWTNDDNVGGLTGTVFNAWQIPVGLYTFTYTIIDGPCPRSYEIKMNVISDCVVEACLSVVIHNALTPNGDAFNQYFNIENIEDTECYPTNKVEIYNRWGILVYETTNYDNNTRRFEGISEGRVTVDKNSELPTGTYFYIIQWTTTNGSTINKNGYLYLSR